jgi:hypothetical protein
VSVHLDSERTKEVMRGHHSEQVRTDGRNAAGTLTTSSLHVAFARKAGKERCR